jgi:FtsZ-interacting cell division protein ZipA
MSDLQVALIILGVFIIAGVVIYNWMQERKLRNEVASDFIVPQKDVLSDDFHLDADAYLIDKELAEVTDKIQHFEPTIPVPSIKNASSKAVNEVAENITDHISKAQNAKATDEVNEEIAEASAEVAAKHAEQSQAYVPEPIIQAALHEKMKDLQANLPDFTNPQIDLTAILYATKNISAKDLSAFTASFAGVGLPLKVHGLDGEDRWQDLSASSDTATFKQVACSLQLADRGGPIAKNLLNKFQFAVEDTGLELNAHVEWQGSGDAMQRAIELDQFCIEVDQMVSVHIAQTDAPIHGTKFKGLAEASNMQLKDDGKFHYYTQGKNEPQFVLIDTNHQPFTAENLRSNVFKSVTFQIEIPKVNNCEQAFNQLITIAQKMASSLNASLVDDNQKPLGDLQIEKIRQQLRVIHSTMVARGVLPGSPSSMRLFN